VGTFSINLFESALHGWCIFSAKIYEDGKKFKLLAIFQRRVYSIVHHWIKRVEHCWTHTRSSEVPVNLPAMKMAKTMGLMVTKK
jgi:hypothetical protein